MNSKKSLITVITAIVLIALAVMFPKVFFKEEITPVTTDITDSSSVTVSDYYSHEDNYTDNNEEPEETSSETSIKETEKTTAESKASNTVAYRFRNEKLLNQHFEKHGKEMGFNNAKEYEAAAANVVTNKKALHKTEAEDGDDVYYIESTNEFVVVSKDGYLRTYFNPSGGKKYFDKQ